MGSLHKRHAIASPGIEATPQSRLVRAASPSEPETSNPTPIGSVHRNEHNCKHDSARQTVPIPCTRRKPGGSFTAHWVRGLAPTALILVHEFLQYRWNWSTRHLYDGPINGIL